MPFRRNIGRERTLLRHWRRGDTVKVASLLTGIPEGSISHYYARFNRNPEKYQKIANNPHNDPPYSHPSDVAIALLAGMKFYLM